MANLKTRKLAAHNGYRSQKGATVTPFVRARCLSLRALSQWNKLFDVAGVLLRTIMTT